MFKKLAAEPPLRGRPAIIDSVHWCEAKSPIDVIGLHRVRDPLDTQNPLIEFDPIGNDCIRLWNVRFVRSADTDAWIDPAIDLDSGVFSDGAIAQTAFVSG